MPNFNETPLTGSYLTQKFKNFEYIEHDSMLASLKASKHE